MVLLQPSEAGGVRRPSDGPSTTTATTPTPSLPSTISRTGFFTTQRRILLGIVCVAVIALVLVSGGGSGIGSASTWASVYPSDNGQDDPLDPGASPSTTTRVRNANIVIPSSEDGVSDTIHNNKKPPRPPAVVVPSWGGDLDVRIEDPRGGATVTRLEGESGDDNDVTLSITDDSLTGNWNPRDFDERLWKEHSRDAGKAVPCRPGEIPTAPYIPVKPTTTTGNESSSSSGFSPSSPSSSGGDGVYARNMVEMVSRMERQWAASRRGGTSAAKGGGSIRPFRFHVYRIPERYITDAFTKLEATWPNSICNKKKTNYTLLDWRHAHSLFTADVLMTKYLRFHPSHTDDPDLADIFIIPMMTHVFNCAHVLGFATEILSWVTKFPYYKRYDSHDHFLFWWRWGMHYGGVQKFWKRVQRHIPRVNLISFDYLEIMGRNNWQDFTLALKPKFDAVSDGIVMPYPDFSPTLAVAVPAIDIHKPRPLFFYFAGTANIGGIRRWIRRNCLAHAKTDSKLKCMFADFATSVVDFARAGIPSDYPSQMQSSVFCGHAAGDALSSRRPTSAVLAGCIPVLICDLCVYAWEQVIDYGSFSIFMKEEDVLNGKMMSILEAIPQEEIRQMQQNLVTVRRRFEYRIDGPPREGDALDTLVSELSIRGRKLRSYRRWWTSNHLLSSEGNTYPLDPAPVKLYLQPRSWWPQTSEERAKEERNFNNV